MSSNTENLFGRVCSFLWPIEKGEYKKFIPMLLIFMLIAFNYNLLRAAKDTMLITAPQSGAEAIPFVKVWVMLPMAFLMTFIFTRLSNKFSREKVFYFMLSIFLGFFFVFTFFLYPNRDLLHPNETANTLQNILPAGFKGLIALFRNWIFTAFYVMSELWSAIILTVLFWGFANEVTPVKQAKRFYTLFGLGANISGILSGQAAIYLSSTIFLPSLPYGTNAWEQSVLYLNSTILLSGLGIFLVFKWMHKKVIKDVLPLDAATDTATPNQPKIKMSLRKNFRYLAKSKYLICIAVIVVAYNLCLNLVEVVWKNQVKELYPTPSDYNIYMGHVMSYTGLLATIFSLFIAGFLLRRFSWTFNALAPPLIMLVTGVFFFFFLLSRDSSLSLFAGLMGSVPLSLIVLFGTAQNCFSRAMKYTFFDATKEMSFIPLSKECKLKGKAAIDGVGSRIGKSGGSLLYQGLLIVFSTISASTPVIAVCFLIFIGIWAFSVLVLGKQFNELTVQSEKIDITKPTESTSLVHDQQALAKN